MLRKFLEAFGSGRRVIRGGVLSMAREVAKPPLGG
eukprot:SAG11_NODE_2135_length_3772_cov_6.006534_3_plen_35_part_00